MTKSKTKTPTDSEIDYNSLLLKITETQNKILELLEERNVRDVVGDFIPEAEAQKILGRKTTWFWQMRNTKRLPYSKVGNKVFYSKNDISNLLSQNKIEQ